MPVSQRPLTNSERKVLRMSTTKANLGSLYGAYAFSSFIIIGLVFACATFVWERFANQLSLPAHQDVKWWLLLTCILGVWLCLAPSFLRALKHERSPNSYGQRIDEDLSDGLASVEVLAVDEVYEVEELDDEGVGFFLSLKDGRVLFLLGQDLYPYSVEADPEVREHGETVFPNTLVEYTFAPNSGYALDIKGLANYLKPTALLKWPPHAVSRPDEYSWPEADTFAHGPIEDFIQRFGFTRVPV